MQPIITISDKDIFPGKKPADVKVWSDRRTVKVILQNELGEIALVSNPIHNCHLLPGGGIDDGESVHVAADRECREEVDYSIREPIDIGIIEEFRARDGKHYITNGVVALLGNPTSRDARTANEKDVGLKVGWHTLDNALKIFSEQKKCLDGGKIKFYNTGFNIVRDKAFIDEAVRRRLLK